MVLITSTHGATDVSTVILRLQVNPDDGIISEHVDTWDALDNNRYFEE
jgi:hypothetical protein